MARSPSVDLLLASLLAKNPDDRPPDAGTVRVWLAEVRRALSPAGPAGTIPIAVTGQDSPAPGYRPLGRPQLLVMAGGGAVALLLAAWVLTHAGGAHPVQAGTPAPSRPPATVAPSRHPATKTASRHPHTRHHAPVTPARAVDTLQLAITRAENSGAIQPSAATELQNQLAGISQSLSQGNLTDAGHKVGDLQHHLDDLTRHGQISARGLAIIGPRVRELARLLPQQP